jgi:GDP-L-fucose synthase
MKEESLLTGPFEPHNEAHSAVKLVALKLCQFINKYYKTGFIGCITENLYGPHDRFHPDIAHVVPALITKFHDAKVNNKEEVSVWGSGKAKRSFLYCDDFADAALLLMNEYDSNEVINVGSSSLVTIFDLVKIIMDTTGYMGNVSFDMTRPDGLPSKSLDITKLEKLGWSTQTNLKKGIEQTYRWYTSK